MKRKLFLIQCLIMLSAMNAVSQEEYLEGQSCTSIMVGCKASTDGSVITSHT